MAVLEFIPDHTKQHDRSGTGLMWIIFNVSLEAVTYKDTILATEVANFSHHNVHGFTLKQDNARPHTAYDCSAAAEW
jgi:hypothetical protein